MSQTPSFKATFSILLLASVSHRALAQLSFPFSVGNISILNGGSTTLDLWDMYESPSLAVLGPTGICWQINQANGEVLTFIDSTANSSVELISGSEQAAGNNVVDIIGNGLD